MSLFTNLPYTFSPNTKKWDSVSQSAKQIMDESRIDEAKGGKDDPRKEKRAFRKMGMDDKKYDAYNQGQYYSGNKKKKNPYPPGKRHDEFERGKKLTKEEQLDELSKKTLKSYAEKGTADAVSKASKMDTGSAESKDRKSFKNRLMGVQLARKKLKEEQIEEHRKEGAINPLKKCPKCGCYHATTMACKKVMKETEQLDEISKKKLGRYIKGASRSSSDMNYATGFHDYASKNFKKASELKNKVDKRNNYISKAVDKLTKEEEITEKDWIQGAIKHPGAETAAAKRVHMSTHAYEKKHEHDSGKSGRRARLGLTLSKLHH